MALQTIPIFYNISTSKQSNSAGVAVRSNDFPLITEGQKDLVINIDYVRTGGGLVTDLFENNDTYAFSAAQDVDDTTPKLMITTNSGFNQIGDRSDLNVPGGKHSFRLNADTPEITAFLGQKLDKQGILGQIDVFPLGVLEPKASFRLLLILNNALGGVDPSEPVINFYNKGEIDSFLADKEFLQSPVAVTGIDALVGATTNIFTLPASTEYKAGTGDATTREITGAAGLPTIQWKTSGGLILSPAIAMIASEAQVGHIMEVVLDNEIIIPAADIVQAEITIAGTSTSHSVDFKFNGQRY